MVLASLTLQTLDEQMWTIEQKITFDISAGFKIVGEIDNGNACKITCRELKSSTKNPTRNGKGQHVCQTT